MMGKEVINHLTQAAMLRDVRVVAAARDVQKASNLGALGVEACTFPFTFLFSLFPGIS